jgi:3-oxoadipate enol-lactonase
MPIFSHPPVDLFYEIKGNPDSSNTVLFLNGVMASTSSWVNQLPPFQSAGFKIVLHDFRGQLKSSKPQGPYTFAQHAQDVMALMDHLNIPSAHLIGTSYGGEVALRCALDFPTLVTSLSIIDSVSELDETLKSTVTEWKDAAATHHGETFFYRMMPSIYSPGFIEKNRDMLSQRAKAMNAVSLDYFDGQITLYETFLNDVTMTSELHRIHCPTLILCGELDTLKPLKFSAIMAQAIQGSEYLTIPDCGHVAIFEKPNELNSALLGFILKQTIRL